MKEINYLDYPNVDFGKGVSIKGENVEIKTGVKIGENVKIEASDIIIGHDTIIEQETIIKGLGKPMKMLNLGDNCFIGFRNQILVPNFCMLDYSQLHNSCLSSGYKELEIGYNCWIGQNSILNSTENLTIGNNVRVGTQSQLWTHVASGELLEGCTLYGNKKLVLMDDVWIVGGAVISPGLVLREKSIIMTGSVLTKNTEIGHTYAGIPAKDVTDKLCFWKEVTIEDKAVKIQGFINEFIEFYPYYIDKIQLVNTPAKTIIKEGVVISIAAIDFENLPKNGLSYFDLTTKKYRKERSKIEIDWIKFNIGFRARFIPN